MKLLIKKLKLVQEYRSSIALSIRNTIKIRLCQSSSICLVFDEWTDEASRPYLGISAHSLSPNLNTTYILDHINLTCIHNKTDVIATIIEEFVNRYGISQKIKCCVTDTARLMISVVDTLGYIWSPCYCHIFTNLLGRVIRGIEDDLQPLFDLQASLSHSTCFKNYCINKKLRITSLPSYTKTRFYSLFKLLRNFHEIRESINDFLHDEKRELFDVHLFPKLDILLEFVGTVRHCSLIMEENTFGSISHVIPSLKLIKECVANQTEYQEMVSSYDEAISELWDSYFEPNKITLLVSTRLNPYLPHEIILDDDDIIAADQFIRTHYENHRSERNQYVLRSRTERSYGLSMEFFRKQSTNNDEFCEYLKISSNLKDTNGNLHQFWVENSKKFPKLSKLAFDYLQIPASNASAERQFSKAKKIVTMRRLAMSGERVGDSVMVAGNYDISKDLIK